MKIALSSDIELQDTNVETLSRLFIAWGFAKLFFSAFLNSKGTYNNGNYHCSHLPHTCYFSLYLDSFSNTLREVYYYYYYYYYYGSCTHLDARLKKNTTTTARRITVAKLRV